MARLGSFERGHIEAGRIGGDGGEASGCWPQEVRKLLFDAHEEASTLRAERRALVTRANDLESRLEASQSQVAALTEQLKRLQARRRRPAAAPAPPPATDQWLTDVTDRTATALRSGQEMAQSLVERAGQRAREIEQTALQEAAAIRARTDAQASRVLRLAHYDAEGILQGAQASAEELLVEARKAANEVMAELHRRRDALAREIETLEARRVSLLEACASIRRPVEDAIRALERGGADPRPPARSPRQALAAAVTTARRVSARTPGA